MTRRLQAVRLLDRRANQRLDPRGVRRLGRHDVPDLDRVGPEGGVRAHRLAHHRVARHVDELPLGGEVEPEVDGGEQRAGRRDARGVRIVREPVAEGPGPGISADVEDRRDAGAEIAAEEPLRMRLEVGLDLRVGIRVAKVGGVRAAVEPAGLAEVDVGVDQPGDEPGAPGIGPRGAGRNRAGLASPGACDAAAADQDDGVGDGRRAGPVEQRRAGDGAGGLGGEGGRRREEREDRDDRADGHGHTGEGNRCVGIRSTRWKVTGEWMVVLLPLRHCCRSGTGAPSVAVIRAPARRHAPFAAPRRSRTSDVGTESASSFWTSESSRT